MKYHAQYDKQAQGVTHDLTGGWSVTFEPTGAITIRNERHRISLSAQEANRLRFFCAAAHALERA